MHYLAFLSVQFFYIGGPPIQGALSGSWDGVIAVSAARRYLSNALTSESWCFCIDGPPIQNKGPNDFNRCTLVSAGRRYKSFDIFLFHHFTLVSVACRYQGSVIIKFISFKLYRRPANTVGIQRYRFVHLYFIGGLHYSVSGFKLVGHVSSSSIGRSIPPISSMSEHPLLISRSQTS